MAAENLPNPQAVFYQYYDSVRRDEVVGVLLALFLGGFGAHQFYLRRTGLGVFYLLFCWTPIPWFAGLIECFFMPGRVRAFNAFQAASIAGSPGFADAAGLSASLACVPAVSTEPLQRAFPGVFVACRHCGQSNQAGARFCSSCGMAQA